MENTTTTASKGAVEPKRSARFGRLTTAEDLDRLHTVRERIAKRLIAGASIQDDLRSSEVRRAIRAEIRPPADPDHNWVIMAWDTEIGGDCRMVARLRHATTIERDVALRFTDESSAQDWLAAHRNPDSNGKPDFQIGPRKLHLDAFRPRVVRLDDEPKAVSS